jgi:DNA polymerase
MGKQGFFRLGGADAARAPLPTLPACGACGLLKVCKSPKMPVDGEGRRGILICGEAPGADEDSQGKPFVGQSGDELWSALAKFGVKRRDCWVTNSLRCRPQKNEYPPKAVDYCRPYLIQAVQELKPSTIIPLGKWAVESLLGWLWRGEGGVGSISRWRGWQIPCQKLNAWVCPAWHPSFVMRTDYGDSGKREDWKGARENEVRKMIWLADLEKAAARTGRPWEAVPDYARQCQRIFDPNAVRAALAPFLAGRRPVAFDYETTTLKPDSAASEIVCCSVSDGRVSYAYPWHGDAIKVTKELLTGPVPKIGFNAKFEERWTLKHLGVPVNNWVHDGMLAAHTLDNRPDTKSLEFQSFALLGWESHKDISPFFRSDGSNKTNRIREVPLDKLLLYCALDSLVEWKVAKIQSRKLGTAWK